MCDKLELDAVRGQTEGLSNQNLTVDNLAVSSLKIL
ncbi:MAG: hypothetical protein QOJ64_2162 [Acidobacteriota bacterium]|jgi:hypothetical protein|nr:hypothetical protein [Acidobacteriota bacterium]